MIALVGLWWWQGHQADQQELVSMASQDIGRKIVRKKNTNTIESPLSTLDNNSPSSEG